MPSFGEMLVILVVALIVLGPEQLPQAARALGRLVRTLRGLSSQFMDTLERAAETPDAATHAVKELKEMGRQLRDLKESIANPGNLLAKTVHDVPRAVEAPVARSENPVAAAPMATDIRGAVAGAKLESGAGEANALEADAVPTDPAKLLHGFDVDALMKRSPPAGIVPRTPESSLPGAESSLPGAESSLPGAESSLPGAEPSLPGAESSLPGAESLPPIPEISSPAPISIHAKEGTIDEKLGNEPAPRERAAERGSA